MLILLLCSHLSSRTVPPPSLSSHLLQWPMKDLLRVTQPMFPGAVLIHLPKSTLPMFLVTARGTSLTTPRIPSPGQHLRPRKSLTQPLPRQAAAAMANPEVARPVVIRRVVVRRVDLPALLATRLELAVEVMVVTQAARALDRAPVVTPSLRPSTTTLRPMEISRFVTRPP
jgi:hypothetical protein